jgi:hypothetical protein
MTSGLFFHDAVQTFPVKAGKPQFSRYRHQEWRYVTPSISGTRLAVSISGCSVSVAITDCFLCSRDFLAQSAALMHMLSGFLGY